MNNLARQMFPEKAALYDAGICVDCQHGINFMEFKDEQSKAEYKISGMCQKCQDKFFV
jgi:hypothetical protein